MCAFGGRNYRKSSKRKVKSEPKESYLVSTIANLLEMILPDLYLDVLGPTEFQDENFKRKRVVNSAKAVERSKNIRANTILI